MPKRSSFCLLALAACFAFSAIAAAAGSDFSALSKRSAKKPLTNPGQSAKVTVGCKGAKSAVSGGFDIGKATFLHGPVMTASRAKGGGWLTAANEFANGPASDHITGDVNCASTVPRTTVESARASVPPGGVTSAKAKCTAGKSAVAGGFKTRYHGDAEAGDVSGAIIVASYRTGAKAWKVTATGVDTSQQAHAGQRSAGNARGGATTPLKAYVYCADVPPLKAVTREATGSSDHSTVRTTAKCPGHQRAVSGGFRSRVSHGMIGLGSNLPASSRLKGKSSWKTKAFFVAFGVDSLKWTGYAYCAG
jgi:hypothetical protein